MKKYLWIFIFTLIILPFNVSALKLNTKVTGSDSTFNGSKIVYTIIVDQKLTNYKAEIIYDRDVLNLVDIKEINIDTTTKKFNIDKEESVFVTSESESNSSIIYTVEFKVKDLINIDKTEIEVKTLLAKSSEQEFNIDDVTVDLSISASNAVDDDKLESSAVGTSYIKRVLNSIKSLSNKTGDWLLYGSLILNIILIISLIANAIRKKVDYDF